LVKLSAMWRNIVVYSWRISSIRFHSIWHACTSDRECFTRTSEASMGNKQKRGLVLVLVLMFMWTQPQAINTQRAAALRYEILSNKLLHPNTRKSQNRHIVQINLQSDYTALLLIGIKAFYANMIKKITEISWARMSFASPAKIGWCYLRGSVPTATWQAYTLYCLNRGMLFCTGA